MQRATASRNFVNDANKGFVLEKVAVTNCLSDFGQRLINNSARADVHMSDFGVAHLPVGKSNVFAGSLEFSVGIFFNKFVENGRIADLNRVEVVAGVANAPAVHDN